MTFRLVRNMNDCICVKEKFVNNLCELYNQEEYYESVESVDSCGQKHGHCQVFYDNTKKKLASEANLVHGRLEGLVRHWHKNGQLKHETDFRNGEIEGHSRSWYENGQLCDEFYIEHRTFHGPYFEYYEDGSIKEDSNYVHGTGLHTSYYQNGRLKERGNYKDGKADGLWKFWVEDGVLIEKVYANGVEVEK